jgi:hypothetical protein
MDDERIEDLDVSPSDAEGVKGGVGDVNGDVFDGGSDGDMAKKLPGKQKPPTLTLKRGKNSSLDG